MQRLVEHFKIIKSQESALLMNRKLRVEFARAELIKALVQDESFSLTMYKAADRTERENIIRVRIGDFLKKDRKFTSFFYETYMTVFTAHHEKFIRDDIVHMKNVDRMPKLVIADNESIYTAGLRTTRAAVETDSMWKRIHQNSALSVKNRNTVHSKTDRANGSDRKTADEYDSTRTPTPDYSLGNAAAGAAVISAVASSIFS